MSWHRTPAARAILASIHPCDVSVAIARPIPGEAHYRWSCDAAECLAGLRDEAADAMMGYTFPRRWPTRPGTAATPGWPPAMPCPPCRTC